MLMRMWFRLSVMDEPVLQEKTRRKLKLQNKFIQRVAIVFLKTEIYSSLFQVKVFSCPQLQKTQVSSTTCPSMEDPTTCTPTITYFNNNNSSNSNNIMVHRRRTHAAHRAILHACKTQVATCIVTILMIVKIVTTLNQLTILMIVQTFQMRLLQTMMIKLIRMGKSPTMVGCFTVVDTSVSVIVWNKKTW